LNHARTLEIVILSLSKDDCLSRTALFDRLRVLVLPTAVVVLSELVESEWRGVGV